MSDAQYCRQCGGPIIAPILNEQTIHARCVRAEADAIAAMNAANAVDAARYRYLVSLPAVEAQAFFWNYTGRKNRTRAVDAARTPPEPAESR